MATAQTSGVRAALPARVAIHANPQERRETTPRALAPVQNGAVSLSLESSQRAVRDAARHGTFPPVRTIGRSPVHEVAKDGALGGRVGRLPSDDDVVSVGIVATHVHGRARGPRDQRVGVWG